MADVSGSRTFRATGDAYDLFMGRYSRALAPAFADFCGIGSGRQVLDIGCGPGALTAVAIDRCGAQAVCAVDPSPSFVEACLTRHPGIDVRQGQAEQLPYSDDAFDVAVAQLVFHFISDAELAAAEMRRVTRPGGTVSACVWDFADGMQMLRAFWDAALGLDPEAPDEARTLRFGGPGELVDVFRAAGLVDPVETTMTVQSNYTGFDELWAGFEAGIGPAGAYCVGLPGAERDALRQALFDRLDRPTGPFGLSAVARSVRATAPD